MNFSNKGSQFNSFFRNISKNKYSYNFFNSTVNSNKSLINFSNFYNFSNLNNLSKIFSIAKYGSLLRFASIIDVSEVNISKMAENIHNQALIADLKAFFLNEIAVFKTCKINIFNIVKCLHQVAVVRLSRIVQVK